MKWVLLKLLSQTAEIWKNAFDQGYHKLFWSMAGTQGEGVLHIGWWIEQIKVYPTRSHHTSKRFMVQHLSKKWPSRYVRSIADTSLVPPGWPCTPTKVSLIVSTKNGSSLVWKEITVQTLSRPHPGKGQGFAWKSQYVLILVLYSPPGQP